MGPEVEVRATDQAWYLPIDEKEELLQLHGIELDARPGGGHPGQDHFVSRHPIPPAIAASKASSIVQLSVSSAKAQRPKPPRLFTPGTQ